MSGPNLGLIPNSKGPLTLVFSFVTYSIDFSGLFAYSIWQPVKSFTSELKERAFMKWQKN